MEQDVILPPAYRVFQKLSESAEKLSGLSSQLFFAAFILGACLLVLAVLSPRQRDMGLILPGGFRGVLWRLGTVRLWLATSGSVILFSLCALTTQLNIDQRRGFIVDQERRYEAKLKLQAKDKTPDEILRAQYLYLPEGKSLHYMSLGNPGIAADFIWLTSLQYVSSSFRRGHKFEMLLRFYDTILDLDPHWVEALSNSGKILSALKSDRVAVEKFYYRACVANPDSWLLRYEAGRMFVVPPVNLDLQKEYSERALHWFNDALRLLKRLPPTDTNKVTISRIEEIAGYMALESDYYEAADDMLLKQATDPKNSETIRISFARDWLTARSMVLIGKAQKRVDAYKAKYGTWPPNLDAIFSRKDPILGTLVKDDSDRDAFGFKFDYDPETGKLSSRGVKARRAIQASVVIEGMIQAYRRAHGGKAPKNLFELQQFVFQYFAPPNQPATAAVTDAIGRDLNVITSPLGMKWEYDEILARVKLPGYCAQDILFRNADKMVNPVEP